MTELAIDDMFECNIQATQTQTREAQKERGAKEGELVVSGTLLNYWSKEKSQANPDGHKTESSVPPPIEKRPKRDKSGDYNAKIPMQCALREIKLVDKVVETRTDGLPGYRVRFEASIFEDAKAFVAKHAKHAWSTPLPEDPTSVRVRQFTTPDGALLTHIWQNHSPGDSIRCTANDARDSIFRAPHPHLAGAFKVQPLSELTFNNVVPSVYVMLARGGGNGNWRKRGAADGPAGPTPQEQEPYLFAQYSFVCKGTVLHREDPSLMELCASERQWILQDRDSHLLVPVHQEREKRTIPSKCYFYVSPKYLSKWAPDQPELLPNGQGVAILRDRLVTEKDFKTHSMDGKQTFYGMLLNFTVFQWHERPNTSERYILQAKLPREDDHVWRDMGITNPDAYAAIMLAHPEIPLHLHCSFWTKASLDRPANAPDQINRLEGTENIRGYYDFIIQQVIPDYLRYFRQYGVRVSVDYVKEEFENWSNINVKTKALGVTLAPPTSETKTNPLHKLHGIGSAVISLGNGQPAPFGMTLPGGCGFNHAYAGQISTLFDGNHDFYVLTSRSNCPAQPGAVVDEWLQTCIGEAEANHAPFYYWLFAVAKNAKQAPVRIPKPLTPAVAVPPPAAAVINENGKRPAPEEEEGEEGELEMEEEEN